MIALIGWLMMAVGAGLLAISMFGVLRLPDTLARQHAGTKAATLALVVMALGVAAVLPRADVWLRLALLILALWVTLPAASHALARAAVSRRRAAGEATGTPAR
jgi:multicomponent Na+:H+ antiporter subunit G